MKKWRSLAEDGHPPVGTVCAYGVDDCDSNQNTYTVWAKGDQVEILAYRDRMAVIYNHTREAADIRNLNYGDEGPLVVALDKTDSGAPDWDNAPEDATHWEPENDEYCESWMKKDGAVWFYFSPKFKIWRENIPIEDWRIKRMIPRPQVEPKEWNGEGLPPAGTVCEISNNGHPFTQVKILYTGTIYCIVEKAENYEQHYYLHNLIFRPIRSEEDRVVEEMAKVFNSNFAVDHRSWQSLLDGMKALYREGYRKQEKK
jgi:hypothetical protein